MRRSTASPNLRCLEHTLRCRRPSCVAPPGRFRDARVRVRREEPKTNGEKCRDCCGSRGGYGLWLGVGRGDLGSARIARVHAFLLSTHPLTCLEHTGSATTHKNNGQPDVRSRKISIFLESARGSHNHPARAYREPCPAELPLSTHPACGGCTGGAAPGHSRPTPGRYCGARPPGAGSRSPAWRALHARAALSRPPVPPGGQLRRPRHTRDTSKPPCGRHVWRGAGKTRVYLKSFGFTRFFYPGLLFLTLTTGAALEQQ